MADTAINFPTPPGVTDSTPGQSTPLRYATPEQIRNMYLMAQVLRRHEGGIKNPQGWAGGLGYGLEHAGANIGAALMEGNAAQASRQRYATAADDAQKLMDAQRRGLPNPSAAPASQYAPSDDDKENSNPDLPPEITKGSSSSSSLSQPDRDAAIRTIYGEAGDQGPVGQAAVAHVIRNRGNMSGETASQVVHRQGQFEPWMHPETRARMQAMSPDAYNSIGGIVDQVYGGQIPDPTRGATHFYSPGGQRALGRQPPAWENGQGQDIGGHRFFRLPYSENDDTNSPQSMMALALAGGNTANDAGIRGPAPGPDQARYAQALQGGANSPYAGYEQYIINQLRHGGIEPEEANKRLLDLRQQMMPQIITNDIGQQIRKRPGLPDEFIGNMPGWEKLEAPDKDKGGAQQRLFRDKNGNLHSEYIMPGFSQGATNPAAPSARPGAPGTAPSAPAAQGAKPSTTGAAPTAPDETLPRSGETPMAYQLRLENLKKGTEKAGELDAESYQKQYDALKKVHNIAREDLPQLRQLIKVTTDPAFYSGFMAGNVQEMDSALTTLGISKGERAGIMQLADKLGSAGSLANIRELTSEGNGAIRIPEQHMIRESNYTKTNRPETNRAVAATRARVLEQAEGAYNLGVAYKEKHGRLDVGFDKELNDYYEKNPFINDELADFYSKVGAGNNTTTPATTRTIGDKSYVKRDGKWYAQ